jgi:hypothetical protein
LRLLPRIEDLARVLGWPIHTSHRDFRFTPNADLARVMELLNELPEARRPDVVRIVESTIAAMHDD